MGVERLPLKKMSLQEMLLPPPRRIRTVGCGEEDLLGRTCSVHLEEIHFDGLTVRWHCSPGEHGESWWHNGPVIRPNISACSKNP